MKNDDSSFDLYYKIVENKVVYERCGACWVKSVKKSDFKGSFNYPILFCQDLSDNVDRYINLLNNTRKENIFYEKQISFMSSKNLGGYKVYIVEDPKIIKDLF